MGTSYGREDGQCDMGGARTAALMSVGVLPVFGHIDEVEEFDGYGIEDLTLHVIRLNASGTPDVFPNADGCSPGLRSELQAVP